MQPVQLLRATEAAMPLGRVTGANGELLSAGEEEN